MWFLQSYFIFLLMFLVFIISGGPTQPGDYHSLKCEHIIAIEEMLEVKDFRGISFLTNL